MEALMAEKFNRRHDRVRAHTKPEINERIDEQTMHRVRLYAHADHSLINERIDELDREWDMERMLEANAASFAFTGVLLGATVSRKWLILPAVVTGFLLMHAVQGWCPPVPVMRRMGIRTRKEIERERYALKALRGDFDAFHSGEKVDATEVLNVMDR